MRQMTAALCAGLALAGVCDPTAWSQVPGTLGADGAFRPLARQAPVAQSSHIRVNGTLTLTLTKSIVSSVPANTAFHCSLTATVIDFGSGSDAIVDQDDVTVVPTDSVVKCTMQIPYEWTLQSESDTISLRYVISTLDAKGNGRQTTATFATIAIPALGATTNFDVRGRI